MDPFYTPETFFPRASLGYLLRRLNKLGSNRVEDAFDGNDITFTQWAVLALVANKIACTCSSLSKDLGHNSGAMTRVLDQLEERGLLKRVRDDCDRRVTRLTVTPAGTVQLEQLAAIVMDVWNDILDGADHEEVRQLIALLNKLLARFEALEDKAEASK
ncbi:virulence master transcriptional regulator RovA [Stakelama sediminis]|uniref:DNA-binding MarR family transcriptional regulator n=1 Tax=Stakelama sediminis TaxID=463200 RepID=A0A840Z061_9SPHN|nr:MarR family transcriptional regulator [Stakelama sediminis]MBB5719491.1 DNA-binding MarR family transcriptional regulator [Stakelama sediminis]